jgi:ABC-type transport system involved in multi-copper enzyme maturation permease subunit
MFATYLNSLHETLSRRVALVLFGVAILVAVAFNWLVHVRPLAEGRSELVIGAQLAAPSTIAVPEVLQSELRATGALWILFSIFAAAPLLSSTLEKGWLELVFSKGTPRSRIFMGRYLAGLSIYSASFTLAVFPLALRLWWQTHVPTWQVGPALLLETLSMAALLSVAALVALPQKGVTLPIIASVAIWILSPALANRQATFYRLFASHGMREIVDGAYHILPKCSELVDVSGSFIEIGKITSWQPIWSTGFFALTVLAITVWLLERKSF